MRDVHDDLNQIDAGLYAGDREDLYGIDANVCVITSDIESKLCFGIEQSHAVVGCFAWLTSTPVLDALAGLQAVSIVVQKESFLQEKTKWSRYLRRKYLDLPGPLDAGDRAWAFTGLQELSHVAPKIEPVRVFGTASDGLRPIMHHKFMVFFRLNSDGVYEPYTVWTGSFNPSKNATKSLENVVCLRNREPKQKDRVETPFLNTWIHTLSLSEPLNFSSDELSPEWQIGDEA